MKYILLLFSIFISIVSSATHNRAGEITYKWKSGFTYIITVTTYTKASSTTADRCQLTVNFGDGTSAVVPRSNGPASTIPGCLSGEIVADDIKKNEYTIEHTYTAGTGSYIISMEDPNRNEGVLTIPGSVTKLFYIESELIIFGLGGNPNSSPVLTNPPIDEGCLGIAFEHNPGAVDLDIEVNGTSDSLSYELKESRGAGGAAFPIYLFPDEISPGPNNVISIDPLTGTLEWHSPQQTGEYNIAILITEWRKLSNGSVVKVGSVLRDLQIDVDNCQNFQPEIQNVANECIIAGDRFVKQINAVDADPNQLINLSATGDPFYVNNSPATFSPATGLGTVTSNFIWETDCSHVRQYPYMTLYLAKDSIDGSMPPLSDYEVEWYTVIAPPVQDVLAEPLTNRISLSWTPTACNNAIGYKIYRREDEVPWTPSKCETGVPSDIGYVNIADVQDITASSYIDDNGGLGLVHGIRYSYLIYYYFSDGSESIASIEFGAELKFDIPIITMVSVNTTDNSAGSDSVRWSHARELDTAQFKGPYQYKLLRKGQLTDYSEVWSSSVEADFHDIDTVFIDQNLNTEDISYTYKLEMYSDGQFIGNTRPTATPFLRAIPLDNRLHLIWNVDVPWVNYQTIIFKQDKGTGQFIVLDTTDQDFYVDSNLANGGEYCYYIRTIGEYTVTDLIRPIFNNSQELCAIPEDNQPPCPPVANAVPNCEEQELTLNWDNPNVRCDSVTDVVAYRIGYRPFLEGEFEPLADISGAEETTYELTDRSSIAGCYVITAIDSFNNESNYSNVVCVDNCPIYELPNVFTPGGDGYNDYFVPFPYRYVDHIDLKVFNRWGELVYETKDPNVRWDGTHKSTGTRVSTGTYFYVCEVFEIRLQGIVSRVIKGHVTVLDQEREYPTN